MPIRVSNTSDPKKVGEALYIELNKLKQTPVQCIGADTVNRAVKAVIEANTRAAKHGNIVILVPMWKDLPHPEHGHISGLYFTAKLISFEDYSRL